MKNLYVYILSIVTVVFSFSAEAQTNRVEPEIWFSPRQLNATNGTFDFNAYDFPAMVDSMEGWEKAASHINTLSLSLLTLAHYPDQPSLLKMVQNNNFQIISGGGVFYTNGECTINNTEGISNDVGYGHETPGILHKWKEEGGRLDYIGMDEPLTFTYFNAKTMKLWENCSKSNPSIPAITPALVGQRAATTINMVLKDFPNAQIVDYEAPPLNCSIIPTDPCTQAYEKAYREYLTSFNQTLAQLNPTSANPPHINALALDMKPADFLMTGYDWIPASNELYDFAHSLGLKVGLFMDANNQYVLSSQGKWVVDADGKNVPWPKTTEELKALKTMPVTTAAWMKMVREHIQAVYWRAIPIDFEFFADWQDFPPTNLPESNSEAYTSLVDFQYHVWNHR